MGGMTRLLLLLWAGVTVSTAVDLHKRILGGRPCDRTYHVKIVNADDELICGGSLISNTWILTAAHCWELTMFAVILGQTQPMRIKAPPRMFSDYDGVHDIMLLQLPRSVWNARIALPDCSVLPVLRQQVEIAGHAAIATGWNNRRIPGEVPDLHCAEIPVVDCAAVRATLIPHEPSAAYEHWFCGESRQVDTSMGDSGGGVVWNGRIYGVISATGDVDFGFASPAAFMDVCWYLRWIRATTGI